MKRFFATALALLLSCLPAAAAIVLNGTSQYLQTTTTGICSSCASAVTFTVWFNAAGTTTAEPLVSIRPGTTQLTMQLSATSHGDLECDAVNSAGTEYAAIATASFTANVWHNGFCSFNGTTVTACLDGANCGTHAASGIFSFTGSHFGVGAFGGVTCSSGCYAGSAAEVAMWNAVLTGDEAAQIALGVSPMQIRRSLLNAYWPLWGVPSSTSTQINVGDPTGTTGYELTPTSSPTYGNHAPVVNFTGVVLGPSIH